MWGPKTISGPKVQVQNILGPKKGWEQKNLQSKNMLGPYRISHSKKILGPKKNLGPKEIKVKENFGSKMNFWPIIYFEFKTILE